MTLLWRANGNEVPIGVTHEDSVLDTGLLPLSVVGKWNFPSTTDGQICNSAIGANGLNATCNNVTSTPFSGLNGTDDTSKDTGDEGRAISLALASTSLRDRQRILELMDQMASRLEARSSPLVVDFAERGRGIRWNASISPWRPRCRSSRQHANSSAEASPPPPQPISTGLIAPTENTSLSTGAFNFGWATEFFSAHGGAAK